MPSFKRIFGQAMLHLLVNCHQIELSKIICAWCLRPPHLGILLMLHIKLDKNSKSKALISEFNSARSADKLESPALNDSRECNKEYKSHDK